MIYLLLGGAALVCGLVVLAVWLTNRIPYEKSDVD